MNRTTAAVAAIILCTLSPTALGLYEVWYKGMWPKSWPTELESLRNQATTLEGPEVLFRHYLIPFTSREEFEAAWPHLVKVKSKGAPIILERGPKKDFFGVQPAGVVIHTPPLQTDKRVNPEQPLLGKSETVRQRWIWTTYIELVVDGKIVDLNRIELPPDTPIIDQRFDGKTPHSQAKTPAPSDPEKAH